MAPLDVGPDDQITTALGVMARAAPTIAVASVSMPLVWMPMGVGLDQAKVVSWCGREAKS